MDKFATPEAVYIASKSELLEVLSFSEASEILKKDFSKAERIINDCFIKEILIVTISDSLYPDILRNIENPPLILYVKGRLPDIDNLTTINIIGTRKASIYGQIVTKKLAYNLAEAGVIIVSGMATGIDSLANKTAIIAGKPTLAVLGCSVDICYPAENRQLMDDIIATGAVISEFPPTTRPLGSNFPQRNRIMSGISKGTLVIEAPEKSGTLITANYALEQGRDVFAIPGNIDNPNSSGCNSLIKSGAKMVTCAWDILEEYADDLKCVHKISTHKREINVKVLSEEKKFKQNTVTEQQSPEISKTKRQNMTQVESTLYDIINEGVEYIDDIIAKSDLKPSQVMSTITMLEIYGDICKIDKRIKIKEN